MYRMFNVANARNRLWVAAPDAEAATEYARSVGLVRTKAPQVDDVTDAMLGSDTAAESLRVALGAEALGQLSKQIPVYRFSDFLEQVSDGAGLPESKPSVWLINGQPYPVKADA